MKKFLSIVLLLLAAGSFLKVEAQDIIMGSQPLVSNIAETVRYFYDPGGVGPFDVNLRDTMTLQSETSSLQLYVRFEEFVMGDRDTLWIYDGASVNAPLVGFYSWVNSPGEIVSSGRDMTFVFHSDSVHSFGMDYGWKAQVCQYDTNAQIVLYGEPPTILTTNAVFYDAGGPAGNIGNGPFDTYQQFSVPLQGQHIKCEFTQFQVNGLMKVYDGWYNDPNKRLIGQFCTSTLDASTDNMPPILFSTGRTLTFEYEGVDSDVDKPGWQAEISCVPELLEYEGYSFLPGISNIPIGYYADMSNPEVIDLDTLHPIVMLQAHVWNVTGQYANDYRVEQIPYNEDEMMFGYDEGEPIQWPSNITNRDDKWLAHVDLPFPFVFFGQTYTTVYPSSNGLVSFDPQTEWSSCQWSTSVPPSSPTLNGNTYSYSTTPYNYYNSAYLVYEDINPDENCTPNGQTKVRYGVLGTEPCRAFVFNYNGINLYSCCSSTGPNTYQMVMYEGSNIIDVYIKRRNVCTSWNGGRGVVGLQNQKGSQRVIAPGRDFTSTWTVNVNNIPNGGEAWRFTPITPPVENGELTWYKDVVDDDHIISQGSPAQNHTLAVRPTETTSYISEYKFMNATGGQIILRDTTLVLFPEPEPIDSTGIAVRGTDFTVYPNPTRDAVYVKMNEGSRLPARLEVLDLQGRLLFTVPAQEITRVDLSRLASGVYLLKVGDGGKGSVVKITKQ